MESLLVSKYPDRRCSAITECATECATDCICLCTLGIASSEVSGKLYPTVGLNSYAASVQVNFGHEPFRATSFRREQLDTDQSCAEQTAG